MDNKECQENSNFNVTFNIFDNSNLIPSSIDMVHLEEKLSNLIDKVKPVAWIYGHTHQTKSFEYNGVKIMENSLGYVKYDSIDHFNKKAVLEI